jgi:hypothetical protein
LDGKGGLATEGTPTHRLLIPPSGADQNELLPIHQLSVDNSVTVFFQGHDHLFARQELDGVVYQSLPNPAGDSYTAFHADAYSSDGQVPER